MPSSIQGNLKIMSLPDVLQWISLARKSGALIFEQPGLKKVIFFRKGDVIGANSNEPKDKIGEILIRIDKISREELDAGLEEQGKTGELIGDIFLSRGLLTVTDFVAALERQATQIIYDIFAWKDGDFVFREKLPKARTIPISIKADFLLMEGIRRIDEWQAIKESFPTLDILLEWIDREPDERESHEETVVRGLVNGMNTILDICHESPLNDFDTCNYLYNLFKKGKLAKGGIRTPRQSLDDDDLDRLLNRGRAFYQQGRFGEAIPFFERARKLHPEHQEADRLLGRAVGAAQNGLLQLLASPNAILELDKTFRIEDAKDLTAAEGFVLSRIDGRSTAKEVTFISGLSQTETCITLTRLLEKGIIQAGEDQESSRGRKRVLGGRETLDAKWKRMSFDLPDTYLSEIFLDLIKQRQTGVLQLLHPPMDVRVYFQSGSVVSATSNMESDRSGSVLLRRGKINQEQYDAVRALSEKENLLQGNALVKLRFISPNDLIWLTKTKVEEILISLFGWRLGKAHFFETDLRSFDLIRLKLSVGRIMLEGLWRHYEEKEILKVFKSWDVLFDLAGSPPLSRGDLDLSETEVLILGEVNGKQPIREIAVRHDLEPLEVLKVLFGLYSLGLVMIIGVAATDRAAETARTREERVQRLSELTRQNYYQILNLDFRATDREIKKRYYDFSKQYHPDKNFRSSDKEVLDQMLKIFLAVKEAYEVLCDRERRKAYDTFLQERGETTTVADYHDYTEPKIEVGHIMKAEDYFDKARTLLFSGRSGDALSYLEKALELIPDDPDYNAYTGLAKGRMKRGYKEAKGLIEKAIQTSPRNADYHAFLGEVHQRYGKIRQALLAFEEALQINPLHIQAKREYQRLSRSG